MKKKKNKDRNKKKKEEKEKNKTKKKKKERKIKKNNTEGVEEEWEEEGDVESKEEEEKREDDIVTRCSSIPLTGSLSSMEVLEARWRVLLVILAAARLSVAGVFTTGVFLGVFLLPGVFFGAGDFRGAIFHTTGTVLQV